MTSGFTMGWYLTLNTEAEIQTNLLKNVAEKTGGLTMQWFSSVCMLCRLKLLHVYVSLRLRVQNAVSPQPCVGKFQISLVLLNFLHCNFRLWFKTP